MTGSTTATTASYETVTELPGTGATREQLSMLATRYHLAADLAAGGDVLEVACGAGIGLGYLAGKARRVVAGDFDYRMLRIAHDHYGRRVALHQLDAQYLPFDDATFDSVLLLEAIYYIPQAERFVAEARRVLRQDGTLLICSANREWSVFNPSPFSIRYYSARELEEILFRNGFTVQLMAGFATNGHGQGMRSHVFGVLRKAAVGLHLIPATMRGKARLKRLLYGKLDPMPVELTDGTGELEPLVPIDKRQIVTDHKVIYAIGRVEAR